MDADKKVGGVRFWLERKPGTLEWSNMKKEKVEKALRIFCIQRRLADDDGGKRSSLGEVDVAKCKGLSTI